MPGDPPRSAPRCASAEGPRRIAQWIADEASVDVALNYVQRVRDYISRLDLASRRGTARDEIRPGLRPVGFEGRLTIAFFVEETRV